MREIAGMERGARCVPTLAKAEPHGVIKRAGKAAAAGRRSSACDGRDHVLDAKTTAERASQKETRR